MAAPPSNLPLSQTPALPAPAGQTANLNVSWTDAQALWIGAMVTILAVPTILVPVRIYIKAVLLKQWSLADWSTVISWLLFVPMWITAMLLVNYGVGLHGWNVSLQNFSDFARFINYNQIIYMPAIFFSKAAVLLQLCDIFVTAKYTTRWYIIWTLIAANGVFFFILMFIEIFECTPREKIWNPMLPGECINIQQTFIATGTINVVDDCLIFLLPTIWIWKLNAARSRKLGVAAIFATGIFACVCSIMRLYESIISVSSVDITYSLEPVALWAIAEVASALVIVCLPALPRLIRGSRTRGYTGSGHSGRTLSNRFGSSLTGTKGRSRLDESVEMDGEQSLKPGYGKTHDLENSSASHLYPLPASPIDHLDMGIQRTVEVDLTTEDMRTWQRH